MSARRSAVLFGALLASSLGAAGAACQGPCFRDTRLLVGMRVLGVQATPVEAQTGAPLSLTLATADESDRPLQIRWHRCPVRTVPPDGGVIGQLAAQQVDVEACLATPPIGTGPTVTVDDAEPTYTPDLDAAIAILLDSGLRPPGGGDGGMDGGDASLVIPPSLDPTRDHIDFVGFACAGGDIGPNDPVTRYPTCTAGTGNGWVFTRTLYFPTLIPFPMPPAVNPRIVDVRFGPIEGPSSSITLDAPPTVPRCPDPNTPSSCPSFRFDVVTDPVLGPITTAPNSRNRGVPPEGVDYVVTAGTVTRMPQSAAGRLRATTTCPVLESPEAILGGTTTSAVAWAWRPPGTPGVVRIWITARSSTNGFAWAERRVVVQ